MKVQLDSEGFQPPRTGMILLQGLVALLFLIFALRFWYLQIHKGEEYARLASDNRLRQEQMYAPRGLLRDRHGALLAENRPAYGLGLVREDCRDIPSTLAQISQWTGIPLKDITDRYTRDRRKVKSFEPLILVPDIPFELLAVVEANINRWPGLEIIVRPRRFYPTGPELAHLLGYVSEADEKKLEEDPELSLGDTVGKQGLELILENRLRGSKGLRQLEVDVVGRDLTHNILRAPEAGENINLSIDLELQHKAFHLLEGQAGCIVVMDPDTGQLLALVTAPAFDNNAFARGLTNKEWAALRDNPRHPMQNRVIQSVYPPASIWKLLMAALVLEDKVVDPKETVFCNGRYPMGNRVFRCWKKWGHGKTDLNKALVESCDVYFYDVADKIGIDRIEEYAKASGFGELTGIDLPHERSGLVPSREWKRKRFGEGWQRGETLNISIGQGFTLVTPLQIARYLGALMNGGKLLKPQLLLDEPPQVQRTIPASSATMKTILKTMVETVDSARGTARKLRRPDAVIGGKTGTAQVVRIVGEERRKKDEMEYWERDHGWMAAWGEKGDKRYVVVVMVEHGGGGSSAAGPVVKEIFDHLFGPLESVKEVN
ncbi:penicillin-binding protein 2 [Oleidesulfovibrio sp.]|uniref:penicillin-binding protein 2 n=1 Tax=Oleidesulfovibrio sp. TaxID=2909707 RepID=UPI003A89A1F3